jgi:hypothetical protein
MPSSTNDDSAACKVEHGRAITVNLLLHSISRSSACLRLYEFPAAILRTGTRRLNDTQLGALASPCNRRVSANVPFPQPEARCHEMAAQSTRAQNIPLVGAFVTISRLVAAQTSPLRQM